MATDRSIRVTVVAVPDRARALAAVGRVAAILACAGQRASHPTEPCSEPPPTTTARKKP